MQVYGPDLMRYKGILYMKGINRRMLFQGVHMMMGAEPGKPWTAAEKPSTKMVFIGRKLPQEISPAALNSAWWADARPGPVEPYCKENLSASTQQACRAASQDAATD